MGRHLALLIEVGLDDGARHGLPHELGQQRRILRRVAGLGQRFENGDSVANRYALAQQVLQHPLGERKRHQFRNQILDQLRVFVADTGQEAVRVLTGEDLMGVQADEFGQMRRQDIRRVHHRIAHDPRLVYLFGRNPDGRQSERRFLAGSAIELALRLSGVDGQFGIGLQLETGDFRALELNDILARLQREIVGDPNRRNHESQFRGQLLPHAGDALEQRSPLLAVD